MKPWADDGRTQVPIIAASLNKADRGHELCSPLVGYWRGRPAPGTRVVEGSALGEIEVLGVLHRLIAPPGTVGIVAAYDDSRTGERAVAYGEVLVALSEESTLIDAGLTVANGSAAAAVTGLAVRAPLSGRFYTRPSPDKPAFTSVGQVVQTGQTVALLEVMKTFNRLTYGGPGLPSEARIKAVLVQDEEDVEAGAALFEVEAVNDS